ncbi:hypothetical protein V2J09_014580 [Rumex salicifolius]
MTLRRERDIHCPLCKQADYDHVLTEGSWLIGDNYLTIRKWIPRFNVLEDKISSLVVWIIIPWLYIEYFNQRFLHLIGNRIGKVLRVDKITCDAERGQFVRLSVEVVLKKPLLAKFRLNGKNWPIQYEGLRMLCFSCGKVGHHVDACGKPRETSTIVAVIARRQLEDQLAKDKYGGWMDPRKTVEGRRQAAKKGTDEQSPTNSSRQESLPTTANAQVGTQPQENYDLISTLTNRKGRSKAQTEQ